MTTLATICLLTSALAVGQGVDRAGWLLAPQLGRGQELVYGGSYTEQSLAPGVQFQKKYLLQARLLVLGATATGWDVAALTALSVQRPAGAGPPDNTDDGARSVRLVLARVDRQGLVAPAQGETLAVPVAGPPTAELGYLVSFPRAQLLPHQVWEVNEVGRPPLAWQVTGSETVGGTRCLKLEGRQQSDDWDRPRADSTAWRRTDHVWVSPQTGVAYRVERVVERRSPARTTPTERLVVRYELDSQLVYPGRLFEDRRQDAEQAARFRAEADRYLGDPAQNKNALDLLVGRIGHYLRDRAPTPYRQAIEQLRHRVEAVRRGEVVATPRATPGETGPAAPAVARSGNRAPDFLVTDLITRKSVRLYGLLGRPVLIVFYNPATATGARVLQFAKSVSDKHAAGVTVLAMAVTEDAQLVRDQHKALGLTFPILDGRGLHTTFGVDATPRVIVLDAEGMVRDGFTGWGHHVPGEVSAALERCLPASRKVSISPAQ